MGGKHHLLFTIYYLPESTQHSYQLPLAIYHLPESKMTKPITYKDAGVDIDAANRATARIRELASRTFNSRTLSEIGGFGGMFDGAFPKLSHPVLVASTDGVGTKLKIAFLTGKHDTVGHDLVNHCVNDILVQGARPLFFLDYIATNKISGEAYYDVIQGIIAGCEYNGVALIGGETAEMPDFYREGEYDIAGFIVGVVDLPKVIDGTRISPGDVLLGLPSVGLHTNGYSLARHLFFEVAGYHVDFPVVRQLGMTVGEALLKPHPSYLRVLDGLLDKNVIKGLAHITGGGLTDNVPRVLTNYVTAVIAKGSWPVLPIFKLMQEIGDVSESEMYRTFNMGIGMVIICAKSDAEAIKTHLKSVNQQCYEIGHVIDGERGVIFK